MPCTICQTEYVSYNDKIVCPNCSNFKILDSVTARNIAEKRANIIRELWKKELKTIDQNSLLLHIFRHREFEARQFWTNLGLMDVDSMFSDTLFLKRVMEDGNPDGNIMIDSVKKAEPIIKLFNETKRVETDKALIDSCYALMKFENDFEESSLDDNQILSNFSILPTETYLKLRKSYENYGLYTREDAEKKFQEFADEYEKIKQQKIKSSFLTREKFIEKNYSMISNLYLILLRNEVYSEVFDVRDLQNLSSDPSTIIGFFNEFSYVNNVLTEDDTDSFLNRCGNHFKKSLPVVRKNILFEQGNSKVFPLVLRIIWKRDSVFLSQAFTAIMYILLHAVLTKDLFDIETSKRGKQFEDDVRKKFEELGFTIIPNVKDDYKTPTLEIDGIAVKDDYCIILEDKNRRLPPEVESTKARTIIIQDLRGIVDGYKRTVKDGQRIIKQVKTISEKMEYVKNNLSKLGLSKVSPDKIFGLVVTQDFPLFSNYKGIHFSWLNEISQDKLIELFGV